MEPDPRSLRVLVCAPIGRDGPASAEILERAGLAATICAGFDPLLAELEAGVGAAFVAEEALLGRDITGLLRWVDAQPPWSDLPFVLLSSRREQPAVAAWRLDTIQRLRNVTLVERPVQPISLTSTLQAALRSRRRQYDVRGFIEARERAAQELEAQVAARTAELNASNAQLRHEMAERATTQKQLEEAREALFQSQKLEAIGQLTGGIAHDFNNLLMVVLGSLALMRKRVPPEAAAILPLLDNAAQAAQRGATLTKRMLAFARRQELKIMAVDIPDLVRGMADLLQRSLGPSITIETRFPLGLPKASTDPNQLESALLNIAVNARDAMPEGGSITVAARVESADEPVPGRYVCLSVTDTGEGMDPETLARATEPFFTTKGVGKGTGLGLSTVHGLMEQSHGRMVLSSRKGTGTTIELWLPVASADADLSPAADDAPALEAATPPSRLHIVAVDDDGLVLMNTVAMLEELGHAAVGATTADQALDALRREAADLVITDHAMPRMTGAELAGRIAAEWPGLPVILATGYAELPMGIGADLPKLAKPFSLEELEAAIRSAVAADAPARPG
ncbi:response regulator [Mycobacterium sp. KBS0706]|uniref:ATP-binding protein n=1 Tax=Mycobacterium sp. KBS0706 TaxID=2578109 RepID=UPI00110FB62C|nr:ATP-binding protein [Mycobacterium sp. KBS0706]TSD89459.1 response regulator [Mycobacterium sp. KBS0706]